MGARIPMYNAAIANEIPVELSGLVQTVHSQSHPVNTNKIVGRVPTIWRRAN